MQPRAGGSVVEVLPAEASEPLLHFDTVLVDRPLPGKRIQQIAFSLDAEPAESGESVPTLTFDMDDPDLADRLRAELEAVYALGGRQGWTQLGAALRATVRINAAGMREPEPVGGEDFYLDAERSPNRHRLLALFDEQILTVDAAIAQAQTAIGARAATFGLQRLEESRAEVLSEAIRYLGSEGAAKYAVSSGSSAAHVTGPDAELLAGACLRIGELRRQLEPLLARVAQEERSYSERRALERRRFEEDLGTDYEFAGQPEQARRAAAAAAASRQRDASPAEPESLKASRRLLAEKQADVAVRIAIVCRQFPVLFRLWSTDTVRLVESYRRTYADYPLAYVALRLSSDSGYRDAIIQALHRTWDAAGTMREHLEAAQRGESQEPWKYSPLVHATLEEASVRPGSLAYAAAEEKLARTQEPPVITTLSDVAGLCHLAAIIGGAAPPVAATLEIVAALLGGAQAAHDAWKAWNDTVAARSSLDAARSVGAEPSYAMTVLSLLSVLPDLPLLGRGVGRAASVIP